MKKLLLIGAAAISTLMAVSCSSTPAAQEAKTIKKIVMPGDYPDPSIVRDGNDFYMTHSSFTYYPGHVYAENGKQYLYTNNCYAPRLQQPSDVVEV